MTKSEILEKLEINHNQFISYLDSLNEEEFEFALPEKWSAGQQLQHIVLSVKPLAQGFILPRFMLKVIFGKTNRPSRSFDALVARYNEKLALGGRASGAFVPKKVTFEEKSKLFIILKKYVSAIIKHISAYSDADMDLMILPHPLLGKLTVREMLYFTAHHVFHHQELVKQYLSQKA